MPKKRSRNVGVPKFLIKLSAILMDENAEIIRWSLDGRSFQIHDIEALENTILQQYYKHRKWTSFQRQLNYFGFGKWTKTQSNLCTFSHPDFLKNEPERMKNICRNNKPEKPKSQKADANRRAAAKTTTVTNNNALINSLRAKYHFSFAATPVMMQQKQPSVEFIASTRNQFRPTKKRQMMHQPLSHGNAFVNSLFVQPPIVEQPIAATYYGNSNIANSLDVSSSISFADMIEDISEDDLLMEFWQSPKGLEDLILFGNEL